METRITINFTDGAPSDVSFEGTNDKDLVAALSSIKVLRKAVTETVGLLLNVKDIDPVDILNDITVSASTYQAKRKTLNKE